MPGIFCDTSGWANLFDPTQPHHALAAMIYRGARQQGQMLVTSNYVLMELVSLMTSPLRFPRASIVNCIESLRASPYVEIVPIDTRLDDQAWQLLKSRLDKSWSLVDCSRFVRMQSRGILEALASDRHFEQAGFVRMLK